MKHEIESLKGKIINQPQDEMYRRGFSSTEHNTNTIFDTMASQTKQIMEGIVRKTEVLMSKVSEVSVTIFSNLMEISIEEEEEEGGNKCFDKCFDDEVPYLRQKRKREVSLEKTKKIKLTVGYHDVKLNVLPSNHQFPPMTCYQLIVNWLIGSVSDTVPLIWTLSSKEVRHINNDMRMWNTMK